ncbi:AhpC/TSA family protein [Belliella pelovolcani]|uniref:AhpC/TSA family protein n=1 Tax=Belliella pelovolcani TaxID=529505 RepID=A0A1N7KQF8_9BACT|nr:AhpC/TSA family protein [Belliella pelovolcani]
MKSILSLILIFLISSNLFSQNASLNFQMEGKLKKNETCLFYIGGQQYSPRDLSKERIDFKAGTVEQISLMKLTKRGRVLGIKDFWIVPGESTFTGTLDPFHVELDPINEYQSFQNEINNAISLSTKLEIIESNLENIVSLSNLITISSKLESEKLEALIEQIPPSMHQNQIYLQLEDELLKNKLLENEEVLTKSKKGEVFTAFELENKDGEIVTLEDLKGKPTLIEFTFTGCAGCVKILPELREVYDQYEGKLNIVSIYSDKTRKSFENNNPVYKKELVIWTSLWDPTDFVSRVNQVNTYPTFILLNEHGEMIDKFLIIGNGKVKRKIAALNLD